jgi:hypothetical protein
MHTVHFRPGVVLLNLGISVSAPVASDSVILLKLSYVTALCLHQSIPSVDCLTVLLAGACGNRFVYYAFGAV